MKGLITLFNHGHYDSLYQTITYTKLGHLSTETRTNEPCACFPRI